jgi:hypothetical protein
VAGIITGVVTNDRGEGISAARVWLSAGPVALPDIAGLSDERGSFTLSAPASGDYTVECAAENYRSESLRVTVRDGERVEIRFRLES